MPKVLQSKEVERDSAVKNAIKYIKSCAYKGTAIKVELEAELNREGGSSRECDNCYGNGSIDCGFCTDGETEGADGEWVSCTECEGYGTISCDFCDGIGEGQNSWGAFENESDCRDFIISHVSPEAAKALIYSKFYNDGSVDSEFTFTLPIDKAPLTIEFIKAFKELGETIGNGIDVSGAGMHIAILNSKSGNYPGGNKVDWDLTASFAKSMGHLMPALYFLASADHRSRDSYFREPKVDDTKYCAVNTDSNCFEYRVFETCYDCPERILDFICVIAKTLQFYTKKKVDLDFFGKVGPLDFGGQGEGIERFYFTEKHLDALALGVKVLKPDYKTFAELKKERNFKLSKSRLKKTSVKEDAMYRADYDTAKKSQKRQMEQAIARATTDWENYLNEHGTTQTVSYLGNKEDFIRSSCDYLRAAVPSTEREYIKQRKGQAHKTSMSLVV